MNAALTREEREAMIAGGRARSLDADELSEVGLLAELHTTDD